MRNPLKGFEKRIERQVAHYVRNPSLATLDPPPFRTRQGVGTTLRPARPRERARARAKRILADHPNVVHSFPCGSGKGRTLVSQTTVEPKCDLRPRAIAPLSGPRGQCLHPHRVIL